jgi:hypothetical protein
MDVLAGEWGGKIKYKQQDDLQAKKKKKKNLCTWDEPVQFFITWGGCLFCMNEASIAKL